jgi:hypothetical protein
MRARFGRGEFYSTHDEMKERERGMLERGEFPDGVCRGVSA